MVKVQFRDMPCHMIDPDMMCCSVTLGTWDKVHYLLYIILSLFFYVHLLFITQPLLLFYYNFLEQSCNLCAKHLFR
jgi:hypothetical protein